MKKILLSFLILIPALSQAQHKNASKTYDVVIGTYTKSGKSEGIYVYRFYPEGGRLAYLNKATGVSNPSYLCISNDHQFVYAVNEDGENGSVSSFKFDPKYGKLDPINRQPSGGADPCYVSVDKAQKNVFVANYSSGSLSVLHINKDGSLTAPVQTIQDEGHGPDKDRQEKPHVHTAMLSPDEKYLLYTDLGTDKINVCRYKPSQDKPLTPADPAFVSVNPGNGPRHIDFSPNHKFAYVVTEMGSIVYAFSYNGGKLKQIQSITMLKDDFKGQVGAADIHVSPDGRFLYASNRGDANEIVIYSINQDNGQLTYVDRTSTFGKAPRNFVIAPDGNYLLVANQNSDSIFVYRIDKQTGKLSATGQRLEIGSPVCLKFVEAE